MVGSAINSTSLFLSWELPPSEQQNGIIRRYLVNVSEVEMGNGIELSTRDTNIIVSDLHPFYHYDCNVSAVTIGAGPYTFPITIQTLQAGTEKIRVYHFWCRNFQAAASTAATQSISVVTSSSLQKLKVGLILLLTSHKSVGSKLRIVRLVIS